MTRPTDIPAWASSPPDPLNVQEPPTGKQAQGWIYKDPPPFQTVNWFWNRVAIWAAHFAQSASQFPSLHDAIEAPAGAPLPVGSTCIIQGDETLHPGERINVALTGTGQTFEGICATGISVVGKRITNPTPPATHLREARHRDTGALIATYGSSSTATCVRCLSDGAQVLTHLGTTVFLYNHDTGAVIWSAPIPGATLIRDLAWDRDQVYVSSNAAGAELYALDRTTGGTAWTYNHAAALQSVATAPGIAATLELGYVFAAGAVGTGGHTIVCIDATNGSLHWGATQGTLTTGPGLLVADDKGLYVGQGTGVVRRSLFNGDVAGTVDLGVSVDWLDLDHEFVWAAAGRPYGLSRKEQGLLVVRAGDRVGVSGVATDGARVFVPGASFTDITALARGTHTGFWRRIDPTTEVNPTMRQLIAPM